MKPTKEVTAALKQFADRLPATHKPGTKPQTGRELLAERPDIKGPNGESIIPDKRYFVAAKGTATNHLKRLTKAYEAGGMPAVVKYLMPYEAFLGTPATEADTTKERAVALVAELNLTGLEASAAYQLSHLGEDVISALRAYAAAHTQTAEA